MPELPEVEVVRAGLAPAVVSARVSAVDVFDERALTRHPHGASDFSGRLEGRTFTAAARRGKFLWLALDGDADAMVAHLGMSGQMLLREPDAVAERHERIRLHIDSPRHGRLAVVFADQRTFGSLAIDELVETPDAAPGGLGTLLPLVPTQVAHIARDALDPAFDEARFIASVRRRASAIKRILLDRPWSAASATTTAAGSPWPAATTPGPRAVPRP